MDILFDKTIESWFPLINQHDYQITSQETDSYNCIAWAANDNLMWWDPDPQGQSFWPDDIPREYTIKAYVRLYQKFGYKKCASRDLEPGYEKVAIYVDRDGCPCHAARQLPTGKWTSKLGDYKDIEHNNLDCLVSNKYGNVAIILKRKKR